MSSLVNCNNCQTVVWLSCLMKRNMPCSVAPPFGLSLCSCIPADPTWKRLKHKKHNFHKTTTIMLARVATGCKATNAPKSHSCKVTHAQCAPVTARRTVSLQSFHSNNDKLFEQMLAPLRKQTTLALTPTPSQSEGTHDRIDCCSFVCFLNGCQSCVANTHVPDACARRLQPNGFL